MSLGEEVKQSDDGALWKGIDFTSSVIRKVENTKLKWLTNEGGKSSEKCAALVTARKKK